MYLRCWNMTQPRPKDQHYLYFYRVQSQWRKHSVWIQFVTKSTKIPFISAQILIVPQLPINTPISNYLLYSINHSLKISLTWMTILLLLLGSNCMCSLWFLPQYLLTSPGNIGILFQQLLYCWRYVCLFWFKEWVKTKHTELETTFDQQR